MRPFRFVLIIIALVVAAINQARADERVPVTEHVFVNSACPGVKVTTTDTGLPEAGYWEPVVYPDMLDSDRYPVAYRIKLSKDGWTLTMITTPHEESDRDVVGEAYQAIRIGSPAEGWRRIEAAQCFTSGPTEEIAKP